MHRRVSVFFWRDRRVGGEVRQFEVFAQKQPQIVKGEAGKGMGRIFGEAGECRKGNRLGTLHQVGKEDTQDAHMRSWVCQKRSRGCGPFLVWKFLQSLFDGCFKGLFRKVGKHPQDRTGCGSTIPCFASGLLEL